MNPRCSQCDRALTVVSTSTGVLYSGVYCPACSKITCLECHGPKPDAPCKNCNGQVRPAVEDILPSSLKAVPMEPAFATKSSAFAVLTPLKCGQCQTGYQLGLTHYALTPEWRLLNDPSLIRSDSLPRDVTQREVMKRLRHSPEKAPDQLFSLDGETDHMRASESYEMGVSA
jgi:hypothetical protein